MKTSVMRYFRNIRIASVFLLTLFVGAHSQSTYADPPVIPSGYVAANLFWFFEFETVVNGTRYDLAGRGASPDEAFTNLVAQINAAAIAPYPLDSAIK